MIGERIRYIRIQKNLSQTDIERKTGLLRCYVSRVENGHTVPSVETLEKFARALDVPMYQLFYESDNPPQMLNLVKREPHHDSSWGHDGKEARMLEKFRHLFSLLKEGDRGLVFAMAHRMVRRKGLQSRES
jgi:transcriptional regulator with XRE-family HTH domain